MRIAFSSTGRGPWPEQISKGRVIEKIMLPSDDEAWERLHKDVGRSRPAKAVRVHGNRARRTR